jgi:hypothetical protein
VSRLVTLRQIEDLGQATLDLYETWPGDDAIDGRDRLVIAYASELLALLVGREIRARTTRPARTGIAVRRAELSRQLDALLSEDDEL